MSLRDLALEEAQLKALSDAVAARLKDVRAAVQVQMKAAKDSSGTKQIAAMLPDGTPVATITLPDATKEAKIIDAGAFLAWVMKTYPTEIERRFATSVREGFASKILAEATAAGVARVVDKDTGEIHDLPGIEIKPISSSAHRMVFKAGGVALIGEAWRSGVLQLPTGVGPAQLQAGGGA